MKHFASVKSLHKRFAQDQKGTVAIMSGLIAIPLFFVVGAAVDLGRFTGAQTHVQNSLDAAALSGATGKNMTDAQRIAAAQVMFDNNMEDGPASDMGVVATFKVEDDRLVSSAELEMPTSLMKLAGYTDLKDTITAEVGILADKKAEVVLVLDYSTSMNDPVSGKVKYVAMREAAKGLVNDLANSDPDKVKIGIVPFSHMVHTTLPGSYVLGGGTSPWTGCTQDRTYPFNQKATTPTGANGSKWNQPLYNNPYQLAYTCSGTKSRNHKLVDLTDKFGTVTKQLDAMTPYGYTHIALGVEFGYHMLSPSAPFTLGAKFDDEETKKFIVVLTDGKQTAGAFGPAGARNAKEGDKNLVQLCENAKKDHITIITMAFDLDDAATLTRLENCASDPDKDFFVANDSTDLATAFDSVKAAVTAQIYISK